MSKNPLIRVEDLMKTYVLGEDVLNALDGVNLSIDQGEFVAIMGASGSGKSTLMNILGCLDRPTSGSYFLAGRDVARLSPGELAEIRNQLIGFVFQNFNLLPRTSAAENVELPLIYAGVGRAERRRRALDALERMGLSGRVNHHPAQLSGGQQQRVAIARAIVNRPRIIFADEPTGNLDSKTSVGVMAVLQELARDGLTVIYVTHDAEVASYASRVLVMRDGRLVSDELQTGKRAAEIARVA
jgi:putative ABC transport system ATP-binding protein